MRANRAGPSRVDDADDPGELERRAVDAYAGGDFDGSIAWWERLYESHMARDEALPAARAAAFIALNLLCESGLLATVRVWAARARREMADASPGPVHALLAIVAAYERFLAGDPDAAAEPARRAVELGTRFAVDPARGLAGRHWPGSPSTTVTSTPGSRCSTNSPPTSPPGRSIRSRPATPIAS